MWNLIANLFILYAMTELPQVFLEKLQELDLSETSRVLIISVSEQKMTLLESHQSIAEYSISTARNGIGQKVNSYQTPLGLHRIKEKIGQDFPVGAIFESREWNKNIWTPASIPSSDEDIESSNNKTIPSDDLITSRILWLEGLEPGRNMGCDSEGVLVDSYQRYIYIHGTNHEDQIGKPSSKGCIRMLNSEMITLFDRVKEGDLVWIQE